MSDKMTPANNWAKIFILQLGCLKKEDVLAFFSRYGTVTKFKAFPSKNNSLNYAYIVFSNNEIVEKILEDRPLCIKQQNIICRPMWNQPYVSGEECKKLQIFVKGFSNRLSVKTLRRYFSQFGELFDVALYKRPTDGRRNGLAFITFTQRYSVEKTLAVQNHIIEGSEVVCQPVHTLKKWRTRVTENDNCENWTKEKEKRDQPRCDSFAFQPEYSSQSTMPFRNDPAKGPCLPFCFSLGLVCLLVLSVYNCL